MKVKKVNETSLADGYYYRSIATGDKRSKAMGHLYWTPGSWTLNVRLGRLSASVTWRKRFRIGR